MPSLAVLAPLFWLVGAASGSPSCTIPGVGSWHEYRSAHFLLDTDVGPSTAAIFLRELEETRALVVQALFGEEVVIPGRVRIVAVGDPRAMNELAGEHVSGTFGETGFGEPFILLPFEGQSPVPEVVAHEIAHHVSWHYFPRQPSWFSEGLAMFLETVATRRTADAPVTGTHLVRGVRGSGGRFAGLAPQRMLRELAYAGEVPVRELLAWHGQLEETVPGRQHAGSWLLYHFLWNHRSKQLTAFQLRLSNGEDPETAWRATFPEYDPDRPESLDALDRELQRYAKGGRYASYRVDVPKSDVAFTKSALPTAEVHLLLLEVRTSWPAGEEERARLVRESVEEALREDPGNPVAIHRKGRADGAALPPLLRPAVAARPDDWRGWYLLARSLDGEAELAEKEAALRRAAALAPDAASAQNALARLLATTGREKEARPFAEKALDLAPWDPDAVDTLAVVAMGIGQCEAAVQLERRAVDLAGASAELRSRLEEFEARCGTRAPRRGDGAPAR